MRRTLRKLIREHACACEELGMELPEPGVAHPIEIEEIIVDPLVDMIMASEDSYPEDHIDDDGRMFDYGHTKSDSHEGRMTRAKLFRMGKMAQSFHDRLEDGDDLPQWVNDKVTTAEDRLRSAFEYIEYKIHRMEKTGCACNESTVRRLSRNFFKEIQ
jgi:hypothetical protein